MSDLDDIRAIEEHWPTALRERDRAWLEAHTTEDFLCIDHDGLTRRSDYIDQRVEENDPILSGRNIVEHLELLGDTAVLVNRAEFLIDAGAGQTRTVRILGSNVYRKVDGSWRGALLHLSEHDAGPGWGEPLL
jgi:ketosteroid isomerase-like protein